MNAINWCSDKTHLAACMTKLGASGYSLLNVLEDGRIPGNFV